MRFWNLVPRPVLIFCFFAVFIFPSLCFSHGGIDHSKDPGGPSHVAMEDKSKNSAKLLKLQAKVFAKINGNYIKNIRPLFQRACLDCHGKISEFPWYYSLPGIKGMMDYDMIEAKHHLDMSAGFPFGGHGTPIGDLKAIQKSIKNETMPPWNYKIMHWRVGFNRKENDTIQKWIKNSLIELRALSKL